MVKHWYKVDMSVQRLFSGVFHQKTVRMLLRKWDAPMQPNTTNVWAILLTPLHVAVLTYVHGRRDEKQVVLPS